MDICTAFNNQTLSSSSSGLEYLETILYQDKPLPFPLISITLPEQGKLRVRKVVTRSKAHSTFKYPCWKMGRMLHCESSHERNAYRLSDANPDIISINDQPLIVKYFLDDKIHTHVPDTFIQWHDGFELWEIKTQKDANKPKYSKRTQILQEAFPRLGIQYRILTADFINNKIQLNNALTILKYGRKPISLLEEEKIRVAIRKNDFIFWGAIMNGDIGKNGLNIICRLYLTGKLTFDFYKPISNETRFYWISEKHKKVSWRI